MGNRNATTLPHRVGVQLIALGILEALTQDAVLRAVGEGLDAALLAWLCIRFELTLLTTDEGLADPTELAHSMRMKRTNLVLDEQTLEEAIRLSGEKTYSAAVMRALEDYVRRARARQILELRGSGAWEGDLGEMRRDPRPTRSRKKRAS